jgi:hypothetical protein
MALGVGIGHPRESASPARRWSRPLGLHRPSPPPWTLGFRLGMQKPQGLAVPLGLRPSAFLV